MKTSALLLLAWVSVAHAAPVKKAAEPAGDPVDTAKFKDKLRLVTDGKKHFVAFTLAKMDDHYLFYSGDGGKTFYQQRVRGGGGETTAAGLWKKQSMSHWEPRVRAGFDQTEDKFFVECGDRKTELNLLPEAESKPIVEAAQFYKPRWKHQAYKLARDEKGNYYYVDQQREPEGNKNFRFWMGPKGNMKLQKMKNVVSDSEGDIFSTKNGELRFISGGSTGDTLWIAKEHKVKLKDVPLEPNAAMIYSELGVYAGELLGTPCDDL